MSERLLQLQLAVLATLAAAATIGAFVYVLWTQPESLRVSREGVPFFTPPVVHPDTGEPITVDRLVEHFKGEMQ